MDSMGEGDTQENNGFEHHLEGSCVELAEGM